MKNLLLVLFVLISFSVNAQHLAFKCEPSIYRIDALEKSYKDYYHLNLNEFYAAWENDPNSPILKSEYGKWYKNELESGNIVFGIISFITNGWLYVLSYEPNASKSHEDRDYELTNYVERRVWLYRKNTRTNGDWELANNNPLMTFGMSGYTRDNSISFVPSISQNSDRENPIHTVLKSTYIKDAVMIIYGIDVTYNNHLLPKSNLMILTPVEHYSNGSIYFNYYILNTWPDYYPTRFAGQINSGKTILINDNQGSKVPKKLNLYKDRDWDGKPICNKLISFNGDFGMHNCPKQ